MVGDFFINKHIKIICNQEMAYSDSNYIKQIELVEGKDTHLINIGIPDLISGTWSDIRVLKTAGKLVPGVWYRITDYKTSDNGFDIIALAVSDVSFSEEARAIENPNVRYFNNCDLLSWKLWCDFNSEEVTITRMIDEYGNDCPCDFKHQQNGHYPIGYNTDLTLDGKATNNIIKSDGVYIIASTNANNNYVGGNCKNITLGSSDTTGVRNIKVGDMCENLTITNSKNNKKVQNIDIESNIAYNSNVTIDIEENNETFVAHVSRDGEANDKTGGNDLIVWYI